MLLDVSPANWQSWCFAILALAVIMAVDSDLRQRRIPNTLVLLLLLAGLLLNTLGPANGRQGLFSYFPGALGLGHSAMGAMLGLLLFLPLYVLRAMGAGDVKLLAAMGAFMGPVDITGLALCVLMAGGVLAIALILFKGKSALVRQNMGRMLFSMQGRGSAANSQGFDPVTQSAERMPYALAFGLGLLAYGYWRSTGHPPLIGF